MIRIQIYTQEASSDSVLEGVIGYDPVTQQIFTEPRAEGSEALLRRLAEFPILDERRENKINPLTHPEEFVRELPKYYTGMALWAVTEPEAS